MPANPMHGQSSWAAESGQDFLEDHADANIDYASLPVSVLLLQPVD